MSFRMVKEWAICVLAAVALTACGGGGGGDSGGGTPTPTPAPTVTSTSSFPFAAGYRARIVSGATDNFNLNAPSTCTGSSTIATAASQTNNFEGVNGFSAGQTSTISFNNCLPATGSQTGTTYYDANYLPIGLMIVGGEYSKYTALPTALPATLKIGDPNASGVISTQTSYSDSTQATPTGRRQIAYEIKADTATTAIANVITRSYDTNNNLLATQINAFRMAESGALTLLSIDVQFSTTSSVRLIYTPR